MFNIISFASIFKIANAVPALLNIYHFGFGQKFQFVTRYLKKGIYDVKIN